MTHGAIAEKVGRSQTAVSQRLWLAGLGKDIRKEWTKEEDKFLRENYLKMDASEIGAKLGRTSQSVWTRAKILGIKKGCENRFDNLPSPALAYILGTLKGDGCVCHSRRSYAVCLDVKDREFIESFRDALITAGLKPSHIYKHNKITRYSVRAWSKQFYEWYNKLSPQTIYDFCKTEDMKKELIRGFYESEGNFNVSGQRWGLEMSNRKKDVLELIQQLVTDIGFSSNIQRLFRTNCFVDGEMFRLRLLGGQTEIARFLREIKPCILRKSLGGNTPTPFSHRRWTEKEIEFLKKNYESMPVVEIANQINRRKSTVHNMARRLGLKSTFAGVGILWTEEEISFVKENYKSMPWIDISNKLGKSYSSVAQKIRGLGLKKA